MQCDPSVMQPSVPKCVVAPAPRRDRHLNLRACDSASYNTMRSVAVVLALLAGADAFVPAARSSQQWVSARSTLAATSTVRAASADGSDEGHADLGAAASQAMATAVLAAALASPIVAPPAAFAGDMAAQMEVVQDYDVAGGVGVDGASSLWMAAGPSPAPFAERKKAASAPAPAPVSEVRTQSRWSLRRPRAAHATLRQPHHGPRPTAFRRLPPSLARHTADRQRRHRHGQLTSSTCTRPGYKCTNDVRTVWLVRL